MAPSSKARGTLPIERPESDTGRTPGAGVGGVLEAVVELGERRGARSLRDEPVGEPRVLRQQRPVEVGADDRSAPHALVAGVAGVPVALEHPAERLLAGAEVRAAAVVLEAGQDAAVALR